MNGIFFAIVLVAFAAAGVRQFAAPDGAEMPMEALGKAMLQAAGDSVTLAIGLIGVMALFLGLMKVAEQGGLLVIIARTLRPLMTRLFPDVPPHHPAMGAMVLNISANVLGLGNAATPFGIRAMQELDTLNPHKGTATNAMAMFLVINTASVTVLPSGVVAVRAVAGSADPAGVVPTTLFATIVATAVAIITVKLLENRWPMTMAAAVPTNTLPVPRAMDDDLAGASPATAPADALREEAARAYPMWVALLALTGVGALIPLTVFYGKEMAPWIIPGLMVGFLGFGVVRKVKVYEAFVEGAKEGFQVAVRIIPYLVAILVAIAMLRSSGVMDALIGPISSVTAPLGLPAEGLTMGLLRMLSGSGAFGYMVSLFQDPAIGPDSYTGYLVSTIQGSTETTFYVLAVYFGAVQVRRVRHALAAGIVADVASLVASVAICFYLYGG